MAAATLGKIGYAAADAVDDLARLLIDPVAPVRFWACDALGRLGPAGRAALPGLAKCAEDSHESVRRGAAIAIRLLAVDADTQERGGGR